MLSSTIYINGELTEQMLAELLEQKFDATWFQEHHRCSIDNENGFVAVDFDPDYMIGLTPDEHQAIVTQNGFVPHVALHISTSIYQPGSVKLAEFVTQTLCQQLDGQIVIASCEHNTAPINT